MRRACNAAILSFRGVRGYECWELLNVNTQSDGNGTIDKIAYKEGFYGRNVGIFCEIKEDFLVFYEKHSKKEDRDVADEYEAMNFLTGM